MSLEEQICERLAGLYPGHDPEVIFESCTSIVGPYQSPSKKSRWSEKDAILICYPDQVVADGQAPLATLKTVLSEFGETFSLVHILPFFPSSSDGGFAVINHLEVASENGTWEDMESIGADSGVMADLVLNHVSSSHRWVQEFRRNSEPGSKCLKTASPDEDLSSVVRPRTSELLVECSTDAGLKYLWCTFGPDQIDVDWAEPEVLLEMLRAVERMLNAGIRWIRLDAVAYTQKVVGTKCVHLEETHELVRLIRDLLEWRCPEAVLVTETNVPHEENLSYLRDGQQAHAAYNFTLAPLLTFSLLLGTSRQLVRWLRDAEPPPAGATLINFLGSHDGIGLRPVEGVLSVEDVRALIDATVQAGGTWSGHVSGEEIHPYEMNVAPASLFGMDRLLTGHTLLASLRGVPAYYFPAVEGEPNNLEAAENEGHNRAINRPKRTTESRIEALDDARTSSRDELIRRLALRRTISAFHPDAQQRILDLEDPLLGIVRGEEPASVTVIANLGFDATNYVVEEPAFDLLSEQLVHGEVSVAPSEILWLSTADISS
ncbi:MAG: alpha-amylase [Acidimicrobiales bacterium]|nr:alpha-amylase [Acidimicrobiales bacterium]|tara:strand:- start:2114 stop:3751 length:1638 start_codon:yes stop_codon:yes gene_type:complete